MTDKKCILVVEDEEKIRNRIAEALVKCDYEVVVAGSGEEALELYKKKRYDLLIIDVLLPGMTGIDFLKAVRVVSSEIGAVIITGYGKMDSYLELVTLGILEYLNKPFKMNKLKKTVIDYFNQ